MPYSWHQNSPSLCFLLFEGKWCLLGSGAKALITAYCTQQKAHQQTGLFWAYFKIILHSRHAPSVAYKPTQSLRAWCLLRLLAASQVFTPFCLILYPRRQQTSYFHHGEKRLAESEEWALIREENTRRQRCASDIIITARIDGPQIARHW